MNNAQLHHGTTNAQTTADRRGTVSIEDATTLLGACAWPAEAMWRVLELAEIRRRLPFAAPILELGCGDGVFTALTGLRIDHAIDVQENAVARASALTSTYKRVTRLDVHDLPDARLGLFRTIFSNSVLEHVPDVEPVLAACRQLLLDEGSLVITVPLAEMNAHLAFGDRRYVRFRQSQLRHRNLWTLEEWSHRLADAGFCRVDSALYLDAASCRYWDRLDLAGALGFGRYRLAPAAHRLARHALSHGQKQALKRQLAGRLLARGGRSSGTGHCAALLIATAGR